MRLIGRGTEPTSPMSMERMAPVLQGIYRAKLATDLTPAEADHLHQMVDPAKPDAPLNQKDARTRLGLRAPAVSELFASLRSKGYLAETTSLATGQPGRPIQRCTLTGMARLALGSGIAHTE